MNGTHDDVAQTNDCVIATVNAGLISEIEKERFFAKIGRGKTEDDCWTWNAATTEFGYGLMNAQGRQQRAHRISYKIHVGDIPEGLQICHHCDNPPCTNPKHLFMGTQDDNMKDASRKGRSAFGDRNGARKYIERMPRGDLHYSKTDPHLVNRGDNHYSKRAAPGKMIREGCCKIGEKEVVEIRRICANKEMTQRAVGKLFNISEASVSMIVHRITWGHIP